MFFFFWLVLQEKGEGGGGQVSRFGQFGGQTNVDHFLFMSIFNLSI